MVHQSEKDKKTFNLRLENYSLQSTVIIRIVSQLLDQLGGDINQRHLGKNLHF